MSSQVKGWVVQLCPVAFQTIIVQVVACDPNDLEPLRETLLLEDRGVIFFAWMVISCISCNDHVGHVRPEFYPANFLQAECGGARHLLPMLAEQAPVRICFCACLQFQCCGIQRRMEWQRMKNIDCSQRFVDFGNVFFLLETGNSLVLCSKGIT